MTLEIWTDELTSDSEECAVDVIEFARGHEFCLDGTVKIKVCED